MAGSRPPTAKEIRQCIEDITVQLVGAGLADDQNLPIFRVVSKAVETVDFYNAHPMSALLKDRPYRDLYEELLSRRAFNIKMLDGALIQLSLEFNDRSLSRSRFAFLPSPDLSDFQNNPDIYLEDSLYADVVDQKVVTVPVRIDFDGRPDVSASVTHPVSHLTLGQYTHCRVATTSPMTPHHFFDFILRSFYSTPVGHMNVELVGSCASFDRTITADEEHLVHVGVPL